MPCEYTLGYSSQFEPASFHDPRSENSFGNQCQFHQFSESEMQIFAGKTWCPFHLPLEDEEGNASPKKAWSFMVQASMSGALAQYIEDRCKSDNPVDLSGLVHWDRLTLSMAFAPDGLSAQSQHDKKFPSISIEGAEFPRGVDFSRCVFTKNFHARGTTFGGASADFESCDFLGQVTFSNSVFEENANFTRCKFQYLADFSGARFKSGVHFFNTIFSGHFDFSLHTPHNFLKKLDESESIYRADFSKCLFRDGSTFNDRVFLSGPLFYYTEFYVAPEFHNCELHQSAVFEGAIFHDEHSISADRSYRTLKLAFEKMGARDEQAMFFALEQKARARKETTPISIRVFSEFYRTVSDYGQDFVMPLIFLAVAVIAFSVIYLALAPYAMADGPNTIPKLLSFSIEQMVRPFLIWSDSYKPQTNATGMGLLLRLVSTLESFVGLGLATISVLALRRRFKLD